MVGLMDGHSSITATLDVYVHLSGQDSEHEADSVARRYGSKSVSRNSKKLTTTDQIQTNEKSGNKGRYSK